MVVQGAHRSAPAPLVEHVNAKLTLIDLQQWLLEEGSGSHLRAIAFDDARCRRCVALVVA